MKDDIMKQTEEFAKAIHFQNEIIMENWLNSYFINKENYIMGKYDNITMKEYMKKKKEMLDDLGKTDNDGKCTGIRCFECPLDNSIGCEGLEIIYPDKALEIVMEYEPKVDWSKVEVDTKVLVRDRDDEEWERAYFAEYSNDKIYTFVNGKTSFTTNMVKERKYTKLYKGDE